MWRYFFDFDDYSIPPAISEIGLEKVSKDILGLPSEFWAAIAGAVVGGIVSGAISYWLQRKSFNETKRQRNEDRADKNTALASSLLLDMSSIVSNLYRIWETLNSAKKDIDREKIEPWQRFQPLANIPERINFSKDDLALLMSLRDDKVLNELLGFDRIHNSTIDIMNLLSRRRQELIDRLPAPNYFEGLKGSGVIPPQVRAAFMPRMLEVNSLFDQEYSTWGDKHLRAYQILKDLAALFEKKAGLKHKISSEILETSAPSGLDKKS
jgi:hypothetical protein